MAENEVQVVLTDYEFSVGEIQEFLDEIRNQNRMSVNALITITHDCPKQGYGRGQFTLSASTANRLKGED
ncbi:hypothetical protein [Mycolicibacterium sphagni]|uniref:Uncharacterized protein n=1 Tax=Mycolicibacterium sphagni TaxID=1786 RepID=A0A255DHY2_9MYCO|nr:hypothetical protein [Mycolicibacterium sphagni]OYN76845.1 hypothetical protein CG716_20235 [Mycolicibacterium sphagni]